MKSWKTTLAGILTAVAQGLKTQFPEYGTMFDGVSAIALFFLGWFAKDK